MLLTLEISYQLLLYNTFFFNLNFKRIVDYDGVLIAETTSFKLILNYDLLKIIHKNEQVKYFAIS